MRLSTWTVALGLAACLLMRSPESLGNETAAAPGSAPQGLVARFLSRDEPVLSSYQALRTLEASARGGRLHARLTAWTTLDPVDGFQYRVVEESGSGLVRQKVLRAALEAERTIRARGLSGNADFTAANYDFGETGQPDVDRGLVRIGIHAKHRHPMLIDGWILVTEPDADLRRVEGVLSRRPSFWTRDVHVVRLYRRISGVRVPVSMESTARIIAAGDARLSMSYEYSTINGEPAAAPHDDVHVMPTHASR